MITDPRSPILPLQASQLPLLTELERLCFPDDAWAEALLASALLQEGTIALGLEDHGHLLGCCLGRCLAGEAELHSIAVRPSCRRSGLGHRLLAAFVEQCRAGGASCLWLEVRADNEAAIRLYEKAGFAGEGRRPRYYSDGEDAILMRLRLQV
jgi:ribosomal-protein-alanine acetyltransferase